MEKLGANDKIGEKTHTIFYNIVSGFELFKFALRKELNRLRVNEV